MNVCFVNFCKFLNHTEQQQYHELTLAILKINISVAYKYSAILNYQLLVKFNHLCSFKISEKKKFIFLLEKKEKKRTI